MFSITPQAAQHILESAQQNNAAHLALRLAARKDEAGTTEYGMGFDQPQAGDTQLVSNGITVVYQSAFEEDLVDVKLDYVKTESGDFGLAFVDQ